MHIPSCATQLLTLQPFAEALSQSQHATAFDTQKWLFVPPHYDEYRYILGTKGQKPLICIGINPSTAAPEALDNTLQSVQRIALHNGYDSFIMFNVYAQRATRPQDMDAEINAQLHAENMEAFRWALSFNEEQPSIWAAWGTIIEQRPYLPACVQEMVTIGKVCNAVWLQAGNPSKKGHPHHPLYLRKDSTLYPFAIDAYLSAIQK